LRGLIRAGFREMLEGIEKSFMKNNRICETILMKKKSSPGNDKSAKEMMKARKEKPSGIMHH
jgi:hypothetical protein